MFEATHHFNLQHFYAGKVTTEKRVKAVSRGGGDRERDLERERLRGGDRDADLGGGDDAGDLVGDCIEER